MASYPTPSLHKSVICDSFMKRDTDLRNGELPRNDFLMNTDSTDYTDARKGFLLIIIREIRIIRVQIKPQITKEMFFNEHG